MCADLIQFTGLLDTFANSVAVFGDLVVVTAKNDHVTAWRWYDATQQFCLLTKWSV